MIPMCKIDPGYGNSLQGSIHNDEKHIVTVWSFLHVRIIIRVVLSLNSILSFLREEAMMAQWAERQKAAVLQRLAQGQNEYTQLMMHYDEVRGAYTFCFLFPGSSSHFDWKLRKIHWKYWSASVSVSTHCGVPVLVVVPNASRVSNVHCIWK